MARMLPVLLLVVVLLALTYLVIISCPFSWSRTCREKGGYFPQSSPGPKRILVTGAAGFIGYHLAKTLAMSKENKVVGLDNYNDYYNVHLKIDRGYELDSLGVEMYHDELCNQDLLEELFTKHNFTHVAHLAAQAGVRYSLQNPLAYVEANMECHLVLLDVMRRFPSVKLVYASSSSVYGKRAAIPFTISASTDRPGNMYAATKKADELLGLHYCTAHGLKAVALRFFTVYGPWGRPDMAIYKFADAIMDHKELPMFHVSDDTPLMRDFTYIDDIIAGVMAALEYDPVQCGLTFNLGRGQPVSVPKLVSILEEELRVKANVKKSPMPPTEILRTWADITESAKVLDFKPKIELREGVARFVTWYKGYRQQRLNERKAGNPTSSEHWFRWLLEQRFDRVRRYETNKAQRHKVRISGCNDGGLNDWDETHRKPLPAVNKTRFIFYQGVDSAQGDIVRVGGLKDDVQALKKLCQDDGQCVAFNTNGVLKRKVLLKNQWKRAAGLDRPEQGLYVADLDVCRGNLNDCSRYAVCTPRHPAQYTCRCREGFYGNGQSCLPVYGQVDHQVSEVEYLGDHFGIFNVSRMKKDKPMYYFPGADSPGGDYMVVRGHDGDLEKLKVICSKDQLCVGINTNGFMKRRIQSKNRWEIWTKDRNVGIFVFDIDYCKLEDAGCPAHSSCRRMGPADYRCTCDQGYISKNSHCFPLPPIHHNLQPTSDPHDPGPLTLGEVRILEGKRAPGRVMIVSDGSKTDKHTRTKPSQRVGLTGPSNNTPWRRHLQTYVGKARLPNPRVRGDNRPELINYQGGETKNPFKGSLRWSPAGELFQNRKRTLLGTRNNLHITINRQTNNNSSIRNNISNNNRGRNVEQTPTSHRTRQYRGTIGTDTQH